jgi:hypothetical protein
VANIVPATAGMRLTAAWLNQFIPGSWVACTLNNSWSNHGGGSAALSVRLINAVTVHIVGALNPGTVTGSTQFGTLPNSSFYPVSAGYGDGLIVAGSSTGTAFKFLITSAGAITLTTAALSGATEVLINCQYALDI